MAPMEDTPAWKAGVKAGDRILKIDGTPTKGMTVTEAASKMRGKKGQKVTLTLYRKGFEKARDVSIVRDLIKVNPVRSELLEPSFGYVRLRTFNENAASDLKKALESFEKKGALRGLVFDMRGNPGGLLDQAVEVSSLFIDEGVVVSTIGRNKEQIEERVARKGLARKDFPVAILVDSSTASAAEIVAGALQDHQRAVVMGQPTFGKGSVQTVIELGQEMGLKLTIARYFTPKGRSIQEKGVAPDILLESYDPKLLARARIKGDALREKDLPGHMVNQEHDSTGEIILQDGESVEVSPKKGEEPDDDMAPVRVEPKNDTQVREALNYLKSFEIFQKMKDKGRGASALLRR
jgi:carboxyl-terminal processing protease